MKKTDLVFCEICGQPIEPSSAKKAYVDSAELTVCGLCHAKLVSRRILQKSSEPKQQPTSRAVGGLKRQVQLFSGGGSASPARGVERRQPDIGRAPHSDKLELVEDFAERIKRARETLGWDQRTLALKLKVSENVIKRIESGKLRPTIELARKIEEILKVKLLVPAVEDLAGGGKIQKYVTLGEVVNIRGGEE